MNAAKSFSRRATAHASWRRRPARASSAASSPGRDRLLPIATGAHATSRTSSVSGSRPRRAPRPRPRAGARSPARRTCRGRSAASVAQRLGTRLRRRAGASSSAGPSHHTGGDAQVLDRGEPHAQFTDGSVSLTSAVLGFVASSVSSSEIVCSWPIVSDRSATSHGPALLTGYEPVRPLHHVPAAIDQVVRHLRDSGRRRRIVVPDAVPDDLPVVRGVPDTLHSSDASPT